MSFFEFLADNTPSDPMMDHWLFGLVKLAITFGLLIIPSLFFMTHFERKLSADLQARVGPNRAGWAGATQSIADLLKLLQKDTRQKQPRWSWPTLQVVALFSILSVLPLGSSVLLLDTGMSGFLPFFSFSVYVLASVFYGLEQKKMEGGLSGLRVGAQFVSGLFPAMTALMAAGIRAGGFRWSDFVASQSSHLFGWAIFSDPFQFLAFVVFVASGLVILGVPPLHSGYSEVELRGGVTSFYSGSELGLFRVSRLFAAFYWAVFSTTLFLGGWSGLGELAPPVAGFAEVVWVLMKSFGLLFIILLVARSTPRVRADQVTDFAWKILCPLGLVALLGTAAWNAGRVTF